MGYYPHSTLGMSTDIRKTTMAEKVKELLPDFKNVGRKGNYA